jgi:hypothetical protein
MLSISKVRSQFLPWAYLSRPKYSFCQPAECRLWLKSVSPAKTAFTKALAAFKSLHLACELIRMGRLGFEPKTNRLKAECSTAELATLALGGLRTKTQARLLTIA